MVWMRWDNSELAQGTGPGTLWLLSWFYCFVCLFDYLGVFVVVVVLGGLLLCWFFCLFFLAVPGVEFGASHLLGWNSTTYQELCHPFCIGYF
jgi:hypothetical protein